MWTGLEKSLSGFAVMNSGISEEESKGLFALGWVFKRPGTSSWRFQIKNRKICTSLSVQSQSDQSQLKLKLIFLLQNKSPFQQILHKTTRLKKESPLKRPSAKLNPNVVSFHRFKLISYQEAQSFIHLKDFFLHAPPVKGRKYSAQFLTGKSISSTSSGGKNATKQTSGLTLQKQESTQTSKSYF